MHFELALPGGEAISGKALVVRHTTPQEPVVGTALRFLDLGAQQEEQLRDFVYSGLAAEEEPLRAVGGKG